MPAYEHEHIEGGAPAQWDRGTKRKVRGLYGGFVGLISLYLVSHFGSMAMADGDLSLIEAGLVGGIAVGGLIAAMPGTFMPALHWLVDALERRKGGGE